VDSGRLHVVVARLVDLYPSHRSEQPGMGAHDRGHVPGLERLELKPAGAIASLDRHRVASRLWSREMGIPIRLWGLPNGHRIGITSIDGLDRFCSTWP
jgi:hypothetical protein